MITRTIKAGQLKEFLFLLGLLILVATLAGACKTAPIVADATGGNEAEKIDQPETIKEEGNVELDESPETNAPENPPENKQIASDNGLEIKPQKTETDENGLTVGFTTDGHAFRGDPNAKIVIKEYSDFQCPFCSRFYNETLPDIEKNQLANGVAVLVYYDFPLNNIHPQANAAANAARCAGEQGAVAFWTMHDALFENLGQWSNNDAHRVFVGYADEQGLDTNSFEACLEAGKYDEAIQADLDSGTSQGISGTPSFLINGQLLVGAQPLAVFESAIDTINEGGTLASNDRQNEPSQPPAAPTPAAFNDDFAGAMGDPQAPVTIVEFTDYQCPYCARHSLDTMPDIVREMVESGRVYYILKDLPLDQLHPDARSAAVAARCAGEQEMYWAMHDIIFENQDQWAGQGTATADLYIEYAAEISLDEEPFEVCLASGRYDQAVEDNAREARALGVDGTPFFFINGYPLNGARPVEHFQIAVELAEEGRLAEAYTPPEQPQQPQQPTGPQDVPIGDAYTIGDPEAPITIVEYTDFQCPFCSRHYQQTYPRIVEQYVDVGIVRYVFKDFPLNNIHPQAAKAAEAARCAGDQGAFLAMHAMLFEQQDEWSGKDPITFFNDYAQELGLDSDTFERCLTNEDHASSVEADLQEGIDLGVTGTPAFFINGYPISGAQPFELFEQAIEQLLAEQEG
ncbi:MAG: thioredoxin domain-containing protein [Chloroflexota bacterium]|jgi:protein-disulfide isomerase